MVCTFVCVCASLTFIFCHRWYTQQNPPRARTYSWSRNPRPGLGPIPGPGPDPQHRPGSAPLYGRLCYGFHTLPVLRDYPAGPLEAGLQLTQLSHGLTAGQIGNSLVCQSQSTFEPLLGSCEMGSGCYEAGHTPLARSTIAGGKDGGRASVAAATAAVDAQEEQNEAKVRMWCQQMEMQGEAVGREGVGGLGGGRKEDLNPT